MRRDFAVFKHEELKPDVSALRFESTLALGVIVTISWLPAVPSSRKFVNTLSL